MVIKENYLLITRCEMQVSSLPESACALRAFLLVAAYDELASKIARKTFVFLALLLRIYLRFFTITYLII